MTTESVTPNRAVRSGFVWQVGFVAALLFIISVASVVPAWAQSLSLTDQQALLEAYRQKQGTPAKSTP